VSNLMMGFSPCRKDSLLYRYLGQVKHLSGTCHILSCNEKFGLKEMHLVTMTKENFTDGEKLVRKCTTESIKR